MTSESPRKATNGNGSTNINGAGLSCSQSEYGIAPVNPSGCTDRVMDLSAKLGSFGCAKTAIIV